MMMDDPVQPDHYRLVCCPIRKFNFFLIPGRRVCSSALPVFYRQMMMMRRRGKKKSFGLVPVHNKSPSY